MTTTQRPETQLLDDEIDLRRYMLVVVRNWIWIVLAVVVGAGGAVVYSLFIARPTYQATALVAITPAKYLMQFSPGFEAVGQERLLTEIYGTYPELAESDELLEQVADAVNGASGSKSARLAELRQKTAVRGSKDVGLIYLSVSYGDPELAATVANKWAELFVELLDRLYGNEEIEYQFFAAQLVTAQEELGATQDALTEFKARDLSGVLQSVLNDANDALDRYLSRKSQIEVITQDIQGWRQQISEASDSSFSQADELTSILVQLRAFDVLGRTDLQIGLGQTHSDLLSQQEQLERLDGLLDLLLVWTEDADLKIAELEPEILRVQGNLQAALNEGDRLTQEAEIAKSLYRSLALKAEEARIALASQSGVGRLASKAAVPAFPTGPRKLFSVALGAVLGLVAGIGVAAVREMMGSSRRSEGHQGPGDGH